MSRTGTLQNTGAGFDGGTCCQHIVDQQNFFPFHHRAPARMDLERIPNVTPSFLGDEPRLRSGPAPAQQQVGCELDRLIARKVARQQQRLIVPSRDETTPMQRHRRHEISLGNQLGTCSRHPGPARSRHVGAIAMLERQDEAAAAVVVHEGGTRPTKPWPSDKAGGAQGPRAKLFTERRAAAVAMRWADKGEAWPAGGAQRTWCADNFAASQTERGQDAVEQATAGDGKGLERHGFQLRRANVPPSGQRPYSSPAFRPTYTR